MPSSTKRNRRQQAVLMRFLRYDREANAVVDVAEEIRVRWQFIRKESLNSKGEPIAIDAEVVVAEDIKVDSSMWLGSLDDWNDVDVDHTQLMVVKTVEKIPNVKNRTHRRLLGLIRLTDVQPSS